MTAKKTVVRTCVLLYFFSQIFFLVNIQFPTKHDFDEFHYVPAAKQLLALQETHNWEHPPLAKELMAMGIALGGDRPLGWRLMSTAFGALTLVGMYLLGLALFPGRPGVALWAALLTLVNQLLYVQARIGMLDTFMMAFLAWGLAAFAWTYMQGAAMPLARARRVLAFSGLMFGAAVACKWFAVVPWFACLGLVAIVRLMQRWGIAFARPNENDWYRPGLWKGVTTADWVHYLVLHPLFVYFVTFIPYFFCTAPDGQVHFGFWDLFAAQKRMWDGQLLVVNSHPYMSSWLQWPLITRPIWYAFDHEGEAWVRGVLLIGNPLVMWGGLVAVASCFWAWVTRRERTGFLIFFFYATLYLSWAVIPRRICFYYYYYPAGMILSFALAYVFDTLEREESGLPWKRWLFLGLSAAMFVYFFPILAALRIPSGAFVRWMWLRSWI